ncbi:MAG: DUF5036 family protein [Muribaculaceae bacterium]|nr:DUF5036 family protein [Muribaculaceae bacterium]
MNKSLIAILTLASFAVTACSDNDEPEIPANAITLNMTAGNSATTVGGSDVYINQSLNFTSSQCGIAVLGSNGGFDRNPDLSQIAQETAVTPGNYYQIFYAGNVSTVAGRRAYPIRYNYYNVYVDSWTYDKDNNINGAKISYVERYPQAKQLPEWGTVVETVDFSKVGYHYEYTFDKDIVIDRGYEVYNFENSNMRQHLKIDINDNRIAFSVSGSPAGKAEVILLIRYGSVYTSVTFIVQ